MTTLTIRNVPDEALRALQIRADRRGRSMESDIRAILEEAVLPEGRIKLGTLLYDIGREANLSEEELANFDQRDRTPTEPPSFERSPSITM